MNKAHPTPDFLCKHIHFPEYFSSRHGGCCKQQKHQEKARKRQSMALTRPCKGRLFIMWELNVSWKYVCWATKSPSLSAWSRMRVKVPKCWFAGYTSISEQANLHMWSLGKMKMPVYQSPAARFIGQTQPEVRCNQIEIMQFIDVSLPSTHTSGQKRTENGFGGTNGEEPAPSFYWISNMTVMVLIPRCYSTLWLFLICDTLYADECLLQSLWSSWSFAEHSRYVWFYLSLLPCLSSISSGIIFVSISTGVSFSCRNLSSTIGTCFKMRP